MQHLLEGTHPPTGHTCFLFPEVTLHRWVPPAEQTRSHDEEGGIRGLVSLDLTFPSPDVLGFTRAQCRGAWHSLLCQGRGSCPTEPQQGADGSKTCSSCTASNDGASRTRHEIGLADVICQVQLFRGSQQENGRGVSSSVPAEFMEQKKQSLLLSYFIFSVKLTCFDSLNKEDQA